MRKGRGRKAWGYAVVVLVTGLALSTGLVVRRWDFGDASGDLDAAARAYRAAGLPWTAADLASPVPKGANAAPLLRAAIAALPPGRSRASEESALRLAHEAAKRPGLDFGRDWDLGLHVRLMEHSPTARLARLFAVRAVRRAAKGDDAGAIADLEDARRLGVLIGREPTVMGPLTGARCLHLTFTSAQRCLESAAGRSERLARYRAWLARPLPPPDLGRAWRGEIYNAVATARNLSREQVAGFLLPGLGIDPWRAKAVQPSLREGLPQEPLARAFLARCLRMNAELGGATHHLTDPIERVAEAAGAIRRRAARSDGFSHNLDDLLLPFYPHLDRTVSQIQALRTADLALADALIAQARGRRDS